MAPSVRNVISFVGAQHNLIGLGLIDEKFKWEEAPLRQVIGVTGWIGNLTPEQFRLCELLQGPNAATIFKMLEIKANGKKLKKA